MATSTTATMTKEHRSSSLPWMKVPRLALRGAKRKQSDPVPVSDATRSPLLELPNELLIHVLSNLEFEDVLSLRSSNRSLNSLITDGDSDIARYWARYQLEHIPKMIGQKSEPGQHWQFILQQTRRWKMANDLADVIRDYIQYKTFLHANAQRNLRFAPVAKQIRRRMIPLLFTVSTYLSQSKSLVMNLADSDDISVECQAHLDAQTIAMLDGMEIPDLKEVHYMWLFLLWLLNSILSVPTYAGTLERTVRGWTADPLDRCSLARLLVFGNLPAIKKLIRLRDYKERRRWAESFLKSLKPEESVKWTKRWRELDAGLDPVPLEPQAKKAMKMDIHMHCLWMKGAELVFEKAGGDNVLMDDEKKPSATTTVRLLADLAGYDLFHAPVPQDYGNGEDSSSNSSSSTSTREGSLNGDRDQDQDQDQDQGGGEQNEARRRIELPQVGNSLLNYHMGAA
ncbi:F-box domain-containing protein 2 [Elsinoe australis]|uniref:F-box domain-containing protein 2 n=1 Tax=Elsinoe australis TaxID=40998 RepID=A0A4U7B777_9PEZI|nr:F-box domain-containing protein 2 [Elsinoe australis]